MPQASRVNTDRKTGQGREKGDDQLRAVALWKREGYNNEEIAVKLGCVPRTVERKLRAMRSACSQEIWS